MNKYKSNQQEFQLPLVDETQNTNRRNLHEKTKLFRLPEYQRLIFNNAPTPIMVDVVTHVGCGGRLEGDDTVQQSVKVCRKCLTQYAVIDAAIDEASKRKRQTMLEKFAGEVK